MSEVRPLEGTVALVTGAARGIGRATALRLAAEGATVAANDREPSEGLDLVVEACGGVSAVADVSDPDAVAGMVDQIVENLGPIGVLVSNAAYMSMEPFTEQDEADWWRQVDTNLSGAFYLVAFLPEPDIGQRIENPRDVAEIWKRELDAMRETNSLCVLTCHPFLSGRPSRLRAIEDFIVFAKGFGDVRFSRADRLADLILRDSESGA